MHMYNKLNKTCFLVDMVFTFSSRVQLELNARRDIQFLRTLMHHSVYIYMYMITALKFKLL